MVSTHLKNDIRLYQKAGPARLEADPVKRSVVCPMGRYVASGTDRSKSSKTSSRGPTRHFRGISFGLLDGIFSALNGSTSPFSQANPPFHMIRCKVSRSVREMLLYSRKPARVDLAYRERASAHERLGFPKREQRPRMPVQRALMPCAEARGCHARVTLHDALVRPVSSSIVPILQMGQNRARRRPPPKLWG
jgi:hypothetical protein